MSLDFPGNDAWERVNAYPICPDHIIDRVLLPISCGSLHHISHPYQVIDCNSKGEHPADPVCATMPCLSQKPNRLQPSEDFLDALSFPLTDRISSMPCRAIINRTRSVLGVLSHVRSHTEASCLPDKFLRVVGFHFAFPQTIAIAFDSGDISMMGKPVNQGDNAGGVRKNLVPFLRTLDWSSR